MFSADFFEAVGDKKVLIVGLCIGDPSIYSANSCPVSWAFFLQKKQKTRMGSLNYPFWGNQTIQVYGNFEGFPLNSALFGLVL